MGNAMSLVVSIGVPLVGGMVGAFASQKDVLTWYPNIKKPKWTPPNFLFAPVWSALYVMMGTASWLVWRKKGNHTVALSLYGAQLLLNLIWNPLFFKTHKTDVALVDITALLGLATAATVTMTRATSAAVQLPLMVPYLVWVSYATALNANICINNPSERLIKPRKQKAKEAKAAKDAGKPASSVKEAAQAAVTGVEAVKAASEAVSAARSRHIGKAVLAADKVPTAGSAAVHHTAEAAKPLVAAAESVKHTAEGIAHAVKDAGAALGVTAPEGSAPPSASAGTTPATMAPASKAIAAEVERATAAAASAPTQAPLAAAGSSALGATAAIEKELKKAGAL